MQVFDETKTGKKKFKFNMEQFQSSIIILTLLIVCLIFSFINTSFIKLSNIHSILLTAVPMGLVAIGECVCIMAGYFDMSVGMIASMGGMTSAITLQATGSVLLSVLAGLGVGLICGLAAGACVSYLGMNAFITTFALQSIYRGIIYIVTDGFGISLASEEYASFTKWGQMKVFGIIQFPIVMMLVIYVVLALFLRYRKQGRSIYLIGKNQKCADICGLNVHGTQMLVFLICDILSALAGILYASRTAAAQPFMGEMLPMEAIAATIVGGTSLMGGKGNLALTFVGVMVIYVVKNGLIMVGLPDFYQYIAIGIILYVAVLLQVEHKKAE